MPLKKKKKKKPGYGITYKRICKTTQYRVYCSVLVHLEGWLWHKITQEGCYAIQIKKKKKTWKRDNLQANLKK